MSTGAKLSARPPNLKPTTKTISVRLPVAHFVQCSGISSPALLAIRRSTLTGGGEYFAGILARIAGTNSEEIALNIAPYTNYAGEALDQLHHTDRFIYRFHKPSSP